jgi:hypothetical protein
VWIQSSIRTVGFAISLLANAADSTTAPRATIVRVIRRLSDYRALFGDDDPMVFILAPTADRPVPAGDTRRGTAWLFRSRETALAFGEWMRARHGLKAVPVEVRLRLLANALAERDLSYVLDPEPRDGYGEPFTFKAPLAQ